MSLSSCTAVLFLFFPFTFGVHAFTELVDVPGSQGGTTFECEAAGDGIDSSGVTVSVGTD